MPTTSRRKRIGRRPKCRHQVQTKQAHTGQTLDHSYVDIESDWDSETGTESEHVDSIEPAAVEGDIVTQIALNTGNVCFESLNKRLSTMSSHKEYLIYFP